MILTLLFQLLAVPTPTRTPTPTPAAHHPIVALLNDDTLYYALRDDYETSNIIPLKRSDGKTIYASPSDIDRPLTRLANLPPDAEELANVVEEGQFVSSGPGPGPASRTAASRNGSVRVRAYTRRDGTQVRGHYRAAPSSFSGGHGGGGRKH